MKQLILGGARSGKSRLAEQLAEQSGRDVVYIATATIEDDEMRARIEQHRQRRPGHWMLMEAPFDLTGALRENAAHDRCLLVDCLTLWVSNHLCAGRDFQAVKCEFLAMLHQMPGHIILVGNEVGMGIVPMGELSRRFVDETGWLHQAIAQRADRVILTVAGLPLVVKGNPL